MKNKPERVLTLLALTAGLSGCAELLTPSPGALPAIQREIGQAAQPIREAPLPAAVEQALLPPAELSLPKAVAQPLEPRFDLAVNDAPADQVFLGIASGSRYSMLLPPGLGGRISVNLKDVTVPEALEALRELYGFDYRIDGTRVFVEPVAMQTRFYAIPYPASVRQGKSELRVISGSIADAGKTSSGSGGTGAAQLDSSRIVTSTQTDFWSELQGSIGLLIGCVPGPAGATNGAMGSTAAGTGNCPGGRSVMVSPHTGMLAVRALPAELRQVSDYLKAARITVERQVMIEAKILEVTLNEGAQTGINWAYFKNGGSLSKGANAGVFDVPKGSTPPPTTLADMLGSGLPASGGATSAGTTNAGLFGLALQTANFMALLNFLETQGSVQVLSSPRIAAINNQKAVLKVGTDEFFVTGITSNTSTTGSTTSSSPTLTVQPFFSGIALDVTPQIDEGDHVILHVHPSVSVVTTNNKTIELGELGQYVLPLAASTISETDSIVRLKDGQIAAIGGLMKRESQDAGSGTPGLARVPLLGSLFKNSNAARLKQELVILLKPTLIKQPGDWQAVAGEAEARFSGLAQSPPR